MAADTTVTIVASPTRVPAPANITLTGTLMSGASGLYGKWVRLVGYDIDDLLSPIYDDDVQTGIGGAFTAYPSPLGSSMYKFVATYIPQGANDILLYKPSLPAWTDQVVVPVPTVIDPIRISDEYGQGQVSSVAVGSLVTVWGYLNRSDTYEPLGGVPVVLGMYDSGGNLVDSWQQVTDSAGSIGRFMFLLTMNSTGDYYFEAVSSEVVR